MSCLRSHAPPVVAAATEDVQLVAMAIQILLADDHGLVRAGIRLMISQHADMVVVGEVDNGRGAVELAKKLAPDIVLMDISMPDLNGIDATLQMSALSPAPKVIALSGHTDQLAVVGMLRAGACGYVVKNAPADELMLAIRTVAQGQVYLSPQIAGSVLADVRNSTAGDVVSESSVLSAREQEILRLVAEGKSVKQIASALKISRNTAANHRAHLMQKLNASSLADLIKYAIREGLTPVDKS